MRTSKILFTICSLTAVATATGQQQAPDVFNRASNGLSKVTNVIAVFQPYLLKARQLFFDGKQLATDTRNAARSQFGRPYGPDSSNSGHTPSGVSYNNTYNNPSSAGNTNDYNAFNNNTANQYPGNGAQPATYGTVDGKNNGNNGNGYGSSNSGASNYLPGQNLPINNPAAVNNDGTGNWGNQNNGLYGNCLDVMTGSVLGMGEATQTPTAVDLLFFAPADGQNTFLLMTPGFAKGNSSAGFMTEHVSDAVAQWSDVNESEVALTKLSLAQFNQIQNNNQVQNAVRNTQEYAGYYASVGQKLEGKIFAVKVQMDSRETYALVAVVKQFGTSGSNGYLKIQIKTTGLANQNGQISANAYLR